MRDLRSEYEIIASWNGDIEKPVVSISCLTFNHEKYIEDALEGFLAQKTNFSFEILLHDDASTDRTCEIIREYESKYPKIIKPIYQIDNQYSKGIRISATFQYPRAKGDFIALCEGDDFWIDPYKLQKQFDFMEENHEFSFCFHKVKELDETSHFESYSAYAKVNKQRVTARDVILNHFIPTLSLFFRRKLILKYLDSFKGNFVSDDIFIEVLLAVQGDGFCLDGIMGVYRHHDGGITKVTNGLNKKNQSIESNKSLYEELAKLVPTEYYNDILLVKMLKVDFQYMISRYREKKIVDLCKLFFSEFFKKPLLVIKALGILVQRQIESRFTSNIKF